MEYRNNHSLLKGGLITNLVFQVLTAIGLLITNLILSSVFDFVLFWSPTSFSIMSYFWIAFAILVFCIIITSFAIANVNHASNYNAPVNKTLSIFAGILGLLNFIWFPWNLIASIITFVGVGSSGNSHRRRGEYYDDYRRRDYDDIPRRRRRYDDWEDDY